MTGDEQYDGVVSEGLEWQHGTDDFMPKNQTKNLANSDQTTWALAGFAAAESKLPTADTYLTTAKTVFDQQVLRWDDKTCGGGLRWQIFVFNNGYDFKNAFSNGNFFELAARLGRNTKNATYSEWAEKTFKWSQDIGFIDEKWNVYDGATVGDECKQKSKLQYSAAAGAYIVGAANLYNSTGGSSEWKTRLDGLLDRSVELFLPGGIATEIACEAKERCNSATGLYKAVFARQLVDTIRAAPYTAEKLRPLLTRTAEGAAKACDANGEECDMQWNGTVSKEGPGLTGQLGALAFVQSLLLWDESSAENATTSASATPGSQASSTASGSATSANPTGAAPSFGPASALFAAVALGMAIAM